MSGIAKPLTITTVAHHASVGDDCETVSIQAMVHWPPPLPPPSSLTGVSSTGDVEKKVVKYVVKESICAGEDDVDVCE